jgi:origin recognition complex subunit 5
MPSTPHPLYPRFLDLIISSLYSISCLPQDIEYISTLLWPIYTATLPPHAEQTFLGRALEDPENPPPPLLVTVKLLTELKHQLSIPLAASIEAVLTRQTGHEQFLKAMTPATTHNRNGNSDSFDFALALTPNKRVVPRPPTLELPLCAKYLIVAAYCASYNPPKSDLRLFGRGTGPDGKRKRGGGTRRAGYGRVRLGKVSVGLTEHRHDRPRPRAWFV